MGVIWYAIGIYILGIAVVLFIRPTSMFRAGGTWKEFGLSTEGNYTVFPFWMFSLVWAVASFAVANMVQIFFASTAIRSLPSNTENNNFMQPISSVPPAPMPPAPMAAATGNTGRVPGYYILESALQGQPRYVYWGTEPPTLANLPAATK